MATQAGYTSLGVMSWSADDPRLDSCVQHDVKELWLPSLISCPVFAHFLKLGKKEYSLPLQLRDSSPATVAVWYVPRLVVSTLSFVELVNRRAGGCSGLTLYGFVIHSHRADGRAPLLRSRT
ncbi:MAG: hypothetical protein ACPIOQ_53310 [Promethearchaeia archaeon]